MPVPAASEIRQASNHINWVRETATIDVAAAPQPPGGVTGNAGALVVDPIVPTTEKRGTGGGIAGNARRPEGAADSGVVVGPEKRATVDTSSNDADATGPNGGLAGNASP